MKAQLAAGEAFRLGYDRAELALLNHPRLTLPQQQFASARERFLLWVGGNSIGKSWGHAWDLVHFARGTHPWRPTPSGFRKVAVAGYSFAQMDPLLEKLWMMLPKGEIHPKLYYAPGQGIKGFKEPVVPFVSGPGAGSVIYLFTYQQGASRIMGFQGHRLSLDEPPPENIYAESRPRLNRYRGELRVTMTPTPDSPPLAYLRKELDEKKLAFIKTSYNEENITIHGGLMPWAWKSQAEIAEDIAAYLADERNMREHGDWDPVAAGRWLERITDAHYTDLPLPGGTWYLAVGMDHGTRPGRQTASLVACSSDGFFMILDEVRTETVTSIDEDAAGILEMLKRNGLGWEEIDYWVGDRATSESYWGAAKSNLDMLRAIAAHLRMTAREAAARGIRITTMFKDRGSLRRGFSTMNSLAAGGRLLVSRRCVHFQKGAKEWTGDVQSPLKDPLDSARYALMTLYDRSSSRSTGALGRYQ